MAGPEYKVDPAGDVFPGKSPKPVTDAPEPKARAQPAPAPDLAHPETSSLAHRGEPPDYGADNEP